MFNPGALPTKVLCLTEVVSADELREDEEYEDILEDMKTEGAKYGNTTIFLLSNVSINNTHHQECSRFFSE